MKKILNKIRKFIVQNKSNCLLGLISLVAFIIGGLAINFITSFIIIAIIDTFLFGFPLFLKRKPKKKNINSTKTNNNTKSINNKKTSNNTKKSNDKTKKKKKKRKWLKILLILFFIGCMLAMISLCVFFSIIVKNAPEFDPDQLYKKESSILYDNEGKEFQKLGSQNREKISYDELPEVLINAIIATMQVIKNTYTGFEDKGLKGIMRKFTDIYMAIFKLEKKYTKEEILEFYVNSYYMGGGAWGVEQASITYFGKQAKDLTLPEASLIAGLFQSPNTYNPFNNPEAATKRRSTVLKLMERHGYITINHL